MSTHPDKVEQIAALSSFSEDLGGPLLDLGHAVDALGGSVAVYRDVVQVFLEHLPQSLAALDGPGDARQWLPAVHELASSLGTVGAMRAHRFARGIEAGWRRGEVEDTARSVAALRALVAQSVEALTAALAEAVA